MNTLKFLVNNNGTMCLSQDQTDGSVTVHTFHNSDDVSEAKNDTIIPNGDMVMLINFYRYVKNHDIQNDFINPNGNAHE